MRLYLVQHGEALSKDVDPERGLSPKGKRDSEHLAVLLAATSTDIGQLYHSGKARAQQTAELIAVGTKLSFAPSPLSGIAPNDPVDPVARLVAEWNDHTLLVGHQPFMGRLAAQLFSGHQQHGTFLFEPGTCVCLERQSQSGEWGLRFMYPPSLTPAQA